MTHGSLFSGIGGFDLAAHWMGWENVFHCEWNPFGQRNLKYYWPKSISYNDITKTNFAIHRGRIDVLTGGFPCQPYSVAGKRKGKDDDRHLWPEMLRAIREIAPRWVVGENVRGLVNWNGGLVFDEVQADLEAIGYEVLPFILPACAVNAPHRRDRVWFVAYADNPGGSAGFGQIQRADEKISERNNNAEPCDASNGDAANANDQKCVGRCGSGEWERETTEQGRNGIHGAASRFGEVGITSNASSEPSQRVQYEQQELGQQKKREFRGDGGELGNVGDASNSKCFRGRKVLNQIQPELADGPIIDSISGKRNDSHTHRKRQQQCNITGQSKIQEWRINQEIDPHENWQRFPTQSPICFGNDGISSRLDGITFSKWRNESIRAAGNAIVPQVALQIFKAIRAFNYTPNP